LENAQECTLRSLQTLSLPNCLVTKEALSPDGSTWGYEITQYGLRTGVPFAGLLLKWSYEHPEYSLYKMFGATTSSALKDEQTLDKKRAQETRYKIFWEIATNPSNKIRRVDIGDVINEYPSLLEGHFLSLSKNSVLSYEAIDKGKSYSRFRLKEIIPDKPPEQYRLHKTLSTRAYSLLTQEYLSVEEIVDRLIKEYPKYESLNRRRLSGNLAQILTDFEKQNYAEREKFDHSFHSEITLSDQQREAIISLITAIDKLKNGDKQTIEEGTRFAQRVANDPRLFSELMLKAKEASPYANSTSREDMEGWIISILYEHPNSTKTQIQQILEEDYDKRISRFGLRHPLAALVRDGTVIIDEAKSGNVYRVVESDVQADLSQN